MEKSETIKALAEACSGLAKLAEALTAIAEETNPPKVKGAPAKDAIATYAERASQHVKDLRASATQLQAFHAALNEQPVDGESGFDPDSWGMLEVSMYRSAAKLQRQIRRARAGLAGDMVALEDTMFKGLDRKRIDAMNASPELYTEEILREEPIDADVSEFRKLAGIKPAVMEVSPAPKAPVGIYTKAAVYPSIPMNYINQIVRNLERNIVHPTGPVMSPEQLIRLPIDIALATEAAPKFPIEYSPNPANSLSLLSVQPKVGGTTDMSHIESERDIDSH